MRWNTALVNRYHQAATEPELDPSRVTRFSDTRARGQQPQSSMAATNAPSRPVIAATNFHVCARISDSIVVSRDSIEANRASTKSNRRSIDAELRGPVRSERRGRAGASLG